MSTRRHTPEDSSAARVSYNLYYGPDILSIIPFYCVIYRQRRHIIILCSKQRESWVNELKFYQNSLKQVFLCVLNSRARGTLPLAATAPRYKLLKVKKYVLLYRSECTAAIRIRIKDRCRTRKQTTRQHLTPSALCILKYFVVSSPISECVTASHVT